MRKSYRKEYERYLQKVKEPFSYQKWLLHHMISDELKKCPVKESSLIYHLKFVLQYRTDFINGNCRRKVELVKLYG